MVDWQAELVVEKLMAMLDLQAGDGAASSLEVLVPYLLSRNPARYLWENKMGKLPTWTCVDTYACALTQAKSLSWLPV